MSAASATGLPEKKVLAPLLLIAGGAQLALAGFLVGHLLHGERGAASWGIWLQFFGATFVVAGLVSYAFIQAARRSVEWFLAWRYLRREKPSMRVFIVGVVLHLAGVAVIVAAEMVKPAPIAGIALEPPPLVMILQLVALGIFIVGGWVTVFGLFHIAFSIFTTISMKGVYLGTSTLVVVLSVMGGFEQDLRKKILGTRAHVVVSKPKAVFSEYRETLVKVSAMPGVRAVAPFIESEVMVASQTNLSGVLVRGLDPKQVSKVTDLKRYLRNKGGQGKLENLLHPEELARIPSVPWGKPLVTPPLGKPTSQPTGAAASQPTQEGANEPGTGAASRPVVGADALARALDEAAGGLASAGKGTAASRPDGEAASQPASAPSSQPAWLAKAPRVPRRPVYPGVIVGAELARNLRLYVGDDVNLVSPLGGMSPAGPIPKARPFRVAGIFYSGMYEYDSKYAYVTIPEAQRFLGLGDEITGLEIKLTDVEDAEDMANTIGSTLGKSYDVRDWQQLNKSLFSALKLEKVVMFIVLTFIILVASFSIVTNLIMIVLEKGREIGVVKAMGSRDSSVLRVFVYAGLYIGVIGTLVAMFNGVAWCLYIKEVGLPLNPEVYYISKLPVRMDPLDIGIIALASVGVSVIATIYPAWRAARLAPVDALRFDGG